MRRRVRPPVDCYSSCAPIRCVTYVLGAGARHVNPGLAEERAGAEHEDDVEHGVYGVLPHVAQGLWGRQVVAQPTYGVGAGRATTSNILGGKQRS